MKAPKPDDTKQNKNTLLNFHFALQNLKYNVIDNISNDTYNRLQGAQLICTFIFFLSWLMTIRNQIFGSYCLTCI